MFNLRSGCTIFLDMTEVLVIWFESNKLKLLLTLRCFLSDLSVDSKYDAAYTFLSSKFDYPFLSYGFVDLFLLFNCLVSLFNISAFVSFIIFCRFNENGDELINFLFGLSNN